VFKELKAVAQTLRVQLQPVEVRNPTDFDKAFSTITNKHADALLLLSSSNITNREVQIVKFATANRLPAMYFRPQAVDRGGLMYYGPNDPNLFFRAATYVDKILKGAKPGDLPFEQPMKFDLVINLKAAKQIGLNIPPNVLARADRVIK
jgi:putative tryptophan/tyrosine transport system substrate-binding protein